MKLKYWILILIIVTGLSGLIYLSTQQNIRLSTNDPQIQMTEDTVSALDSGIKLEDVVPIKNIDLNKSLATFIIVFDEQGRPATSQASLDGKIPTLPQGVLDFVATQGKDQFTWEPKPGVRIAAVVTKFSKGFILTGRSLREIEKREDLLLKEVTAGWFIIMLSSFIFTIFIPKSK